MLTLIGLAGGAATLPGCGFQPLYARSGANDAPAELAEIFVGVIADRQGQILRGFLIEALNPEGRPTSPRYTLSVGLRTSSIGIDRDDDIIRASFQATASFSLTTQDGDATLLQRSVRNTSSYNILQDQFSTLVAEEAARDRVMQQLADDIRTQLALYFIR